MGSAAVLHAVGLVVVTALGIASVLWLCGCPRWLRGSDGWTVENDLTTDATRHLVPLAVARRRGAAEACRAENERLVRPRPGLSPDRRGAPAHMGESRGEVCRDVGGTPERPSLEALRGVGDDAIPESPPAPWLSEGAANRAFCELLHRGRR